jgi:uncharacterized membrane-anchored protein YjiN (DUF445 family)
VSKTSALDRPDATTAVPPLPHEADRRRRLTVMRRWATGTLMAVSLLWLAMVLAQPSGEWAPYVLAALEASMVGALADWFAVVALFRRPLGLPIPHTAIVVARKEQFGRTLATFFRENFLSGPAVRERVRASGAVVRASAWLADPEHARTLVRNVLGRSASVLDTTGDGLSDFMVRETRALVAGAPVAPLSAALVRAASSSPMLDDVIEAVSVAVRRGLQDHAADLEAIFTGERPWWLPESVQHRLFERLVSRAVVTLHDVERDRSHPARAQVREWLAALADRLEHDPDLAARLRRLQRAVVQDPRFDDTTARLFNGALDRLRAELCAPGSSIEQRIVDAVTYLARRVGDDPAIHVRIEASIEATVERAMAMFGGDVDALVTGTISHWDAGRTADQLELLLGPDLQYIRINGAVVGGLAGLAIHALGQAIG